MVIIPMEFHSDMDSFNYTKYHRGESHGVIKVILVFNIQLITTKIRGIFHMVLLTRVAL